MCGIVGCLKLREGSGYVLEQEVADAMARAMWRRGPDSEGQWRSADRHCWFGHRRLAVVDLVSGDQPMSNDTGSLTVVYNGEIYNYRRLRDQLIGLGRRFRTNSDTEVLLAGYEEWGGAELAKRLQGIFAFAIYDARNRSLFLARDHLGVKPLHWWSDGEIFLFASEIKSLLRHPRLRDRSVNKAGVAQFLVTRYVSRPNTMLNGVYKLPEASWMRLRVGKPTRPTPVQYWDVRYRADEPEHDGADLVEQLDRALKETVRMQLMSDVPVGAQLSGGVDSSVIVALMETIRRENGESDPVKTFSVGFDVEAFNEFRYAKLVAERYRTEHEEIHVSFRDFVEDLPFLSWAYDEPMGEAPAIPTYLMCRKAKEKVTVMLCGEGADEQFGGYRKYLFEKHAGLLDLIPAAARRSVGRAVATAIPFRGRRVRSLVEILALPHQPDRFASWYGAFDTAVQRDLLEETMAEECADVFVRDTFENVIAQCDSEERLEQFLYCDIHTRLVDTLLVKADRMSMAASVEARVPFLDPAMVAFAAHVPPELKVNGLETKILLKRLAERYVPRDLIYRRKVGFTMPLTEWFVGPLKGFLRRVLLSERCLSRGYFQPDRLRKLVDGHLNGKVDREQGLWVLLALELWHRLYVDEDGTEAAVVKLQESLESAVRN